MMIDAPQDELSAKLLDHCGASRSEPAGTDRQLVENEGRLGPRSGTAGRTRTLCWADRGEEANRPAIWEKHFDPAGSKAHEGAHQRASVRLGCFSVRSVMAGNLSSPSLAGC